MFLQGLARRLKFSLGPSSFFVEVWHVNAPREEAILALYCVFLYTCRGKGPGMGGEGGLVQGGLACREIVS